MGIMHDPNSYKYFLRPRRLWITITLSMQLSLMVAIYDILSFIVQCTFFTSKSRCASSHAKIEQYFPNNSFYTKARNKRFQFLKCTCLGLQKAIVDEVKPKAKSLRNFKLEAVHNFDD